MALMPINPKNLPQQTYHPMLQESIQHFLTQFQAETSDFTHFNSMFTRLIQTFSTPPIEITWFYAAVNYHTCINMISQHDNFGKILALKELFQLLVSSFGPCSSSLSRVAGLAPLIFELHSLILELRVENGLNLDNVIVGEIRCLVDRLVSYISMCCCEEVDDHDDSLAFSPCFVDLVKVWTVRRRGNWFKFEDDFMMFFPIVSDEVRNRIWVGSGVGVLAGIVMCQGFLLNLCLKFGLEEMTREVEEEVLNSAVNTIIGFRSCYFFDTLLKMLLEPSLPVDSLLSSVHESFLREALLDAIILVDYPFFKPGSGILLCSHHLNSIASTWLFVADRAMQLTRHNEDRTKFIAYSKAFPKSFINSQLLRWVSTQIGVIEDANKPNLPTPATFLEWLTELRSQGIKGSDVEFSLLLDKAMHYQSEITNKLPLAEAVGMKDCCLDRDNEVDGDHEMIDLIEGAKSACEPNFAATEACRKRKGDKDGDSLRLKLLKYHVHGSPNKNFSPFQTEVGLTKRS